MRVGIIFFGEHFFFWKKTEKFSQCHKTVGQKLESSAVFSASRMWEYTSVFRDFATRAWFTPVGNFHHHNFAQKGREQYNAHTFNSNCRMCTTCSNHSKLAKLQDLWGYIRRWIRIVQYALGRRVSLHDWRYSIFFHLFFSHSWQTLQHNNNTTNENIKNKNKQNLKHIPCGSLTRRTIRTTRSRRLLTLPIPRSFKDTIRTHVIWIIITKLLHQKKETTSQSVILGRSRVAAIKRL